MNEQDEIRLRHMLEAAQEAVDFGRGHSRADLDTDRMLMRAIVQAVLVVGEAANNIAVESRKAIPQIPWRAIIAMRNRLVHAYFDINLDTVWDTVVDDLPPLIAELEKLFANDDQ